MMVNHNLIATTPSIDAFKWIYITYECKIKLHNIKSYDDLLSENEFPSMISMDMNGSSTRVDLLKNV